LIAISRAIAREIAIKDLTWAEDIALSMLEKYVESKIGA